VTVDNDRRIRLEELQRLAAMPCGLYRTTVSLKEDPEAIGPGLLVELHDHRPDDLPWVQLPAHSEDNRWHFDPTSYDAADPEFLVSLEPLPPEGLYATRRIVPLSEDADDALAERALVQLSYDRQGRCILFPAAFAGLTIRFPTRGFLFEPADVLDALEPVNFEVPESDSDRVVH
jgi:hypothetical protein